MGRAQLARPEPMIEVEPYRLLGRWGPRIVGGTERALQAVELSAAVEREAQAQASGLVRCAGCSGYISRERGPLCNLCRRDGRKAGRP